MAALPRKAGSRIGRWFKGFRERNRRPYRCHDHDIDLDRQNAPATFGPLYQMKRTVPR
jgi:hypothetical protein